MSTTEINNTTVVDATTESKTKKPAYQSRFAKEYDEIFSSLKSMEDSLLTSKKAILVKLRELQTKVTKLEKDQDKVQARAAKRRNNPDPAQSFVGVNQPKRINPALLKFLEDNRTQLPEDCRTCIRTFMSLNEVNRCILNLGKVSGIVTDNQYNFNNEGANKTVVASLRNLLIDMCPEGFYKDEAGNSAPMNFGSLIATRKMSGFFNHLLTRDEESQSYVEKLIADKRALIAANNASVATTTTDATPVVTEPVVDASADSSEPPAKKVRQIKRKATA
jgi:hypothetical protein